MIYKKYRDGEHMYTHGCFISMYDKIHYNKKKKNPKTGGESDLAQGPWLADPAITLSWG